MRYSSSFCSFYRSQFATIKKSTPSTEQIWKFWVVLEISSLALKRSKTSDFVFSVAICWYASPVAPVKAPPLFPQCCPLHTSSQSRSLTWVRSGVTAHSSPLNFCSRKKHHMTWFAHDIICTYPNFVVYRGMRPLTSIRKLYSKSNCFAGATGMRNTWSLHSTWPEESRNSTWRGEGTAWVIESYKIRSFLIIIWKENCRSYLGFFYNFKRKHLEETWNQNTMFSVED